MRLATVLFINFAPASSGTESAVTGSSGRPKFGCPVCTKACAELCAELSSVTGFNTCKQNVHNIKMRNASMELCKGVVSCDRDEDRIATIPESICCIESTPWKFGELSKPVTSKAPAKQRSARLARSSRSLTVQGKGMPQQEVIHGNDNRNSQRGKANQADLTQQQVPEFHASVLDFWFVWQPNYAPLGDPTMKPFGN